MEKNQYDLGIWSKTKYNFYQQQESHQELNNQDNTTYSENHTSNQLESSSAFTMSKSSTTYPILIVDKRPSPASLPPKEIKLSSQSTTSNITVEKENRRKFNKVDEFLSN